PISGPTRPQLLLQQQLLQQQQLVPTSLYESSASASSFFNNFLTNTNNFINSNITQSRSPLYQQQQQQQLQLQLQQQQQQDSSTTPPTYYNYNYNYNLQQQQLQQQLLQQQHHHQQLYNPFYSQQHLQSAATPPPPPSYYHKSLFGSSISPGSYLGDTATATAGFGLGLSGLGLGGLSAGLGGGGGGVGYTPLGRSYRYYKQHASTGLGGNSSYNGYYSLSFGESYYPFQSSGGGGGVSGGGDYFGRISPAAAHTGPLLATSVSEPRSSLLKLPPPQPPPLLPPLDDDLQVSTEPYLSTYSSRPIDYIPSPPASLRSDTYAYRPRRQRDTGGRYSATGYYTSRQRSRGFSPIIDCDRYRDREFVGRSRLRTNSLQSNCSLGRSSFTAIDRLSPVRVGASPRSLRREKYLSPCGSPKYSSKTSSLQPTNAHESQYHTQAYDTSSSNTAGAGTVTSKASSAAGALTHTPPHYPHNTSSQTSSSHHQHQHSHHHQHLPKLEQPQPYQPYNTEQTPSNSTYHAHKRTHKTSTDPRDYHQQTTPQRQQQQYHYQDQQQHQQQQQQQFHTTSSTSNIYSTRSTPGSCENFHHLASNLGFIQRHRMMVSKLWKGCFPDVTPEHVHRHNFYLCQWQRNTQVRIIYLFYRWITAIICLAALVCSLLDIGRTDERFENHYAKWWIYLTHWGLLFCTVQAWLAAMIVTQGMMVEREDFELMRQAKKSKLHLLYWVLYTCATVYAFIITMCYWLLVHDP
ncbi:hypothetical protein FF38_01479, partial [Lucilia cuprina]